MLESIFSKIGGAIVAIGLVVSSWFTPTPPSSILPTLSPELQEIQAKINFVRSQIELLKQQVGNDIAKFGATIPKSVAVFETSLATGISSSDTSMTLVTGTDKASNSLSGTIGFVIDEGTTSEEFVVGSASGTAITSLLRGISPTDGDLEVASLKKSHRRGATVKITTHPIITVMARILNGDETIPNIIKYASNPTFTSSTEIVTKKYADDLAIAGAPDASQSAKGIVEIATKAELAAGTATGDTTARLVPENSYFNATSSATTTVPVTKTGGKLSQTFIDLTEAWVFTGALTASSTFTANQTSTFNGSAIFNGSVSGTAAVADVRVFTASSTWTKLTGAKAVEVIVVAGGGGGGSGRRGADDSARGGGGGGGGGGYSRQAFRASDLSATSSVTIGDGGAGGAAVTVNDTNGNNGAVGGDSSFGSLIRATGGTLGGGGTTSGGGGGDAGAGVSAGCGGGAGTLNATGNAGTSCWLAAAGGGGGSGNNTGSGSNFNGGAGGTQNLSNVAGGAGGVAPGGAGGAGTNQTAPTGGPGGGGGAMRLTGAGGAAGNGGDGGLYGAGGGGGGSSGVGANSGKGGDGRNGVVIVITYF